MSISRYPALSTAALLLTMLIHSTSSIAGSDDATSEPLVSLNFDLQPLLDSYCVQCHLLESAQGGLVLESGEAWSNLVDIKSTQTAMKRVTPAQPAQSYLLHKLRGTHLEAGGSGLSMPYASEAAVGVSLETINLVERWITEGAHDN